MTDWTDARSGNGPSFAAWIETVLGTRDTTGSAWSDSLARRLYEWRRGGAVQIGSVDFYATQLGYHISEVPSEVWNAGPPNGTPCIGVPPRDSNAASRTA